MADIDTQRITEAAAAVMAALQTLTDEERARVLHAAAALHGIAISSASKRQNSHSDNGDAEVASEDAPATGRGGKRQSIVEFLNDRQPATNAQRIACFAHYREHVEQRGTKFSKIDLEPYFASAKLPKPGNYDRDFRNSVQAGWIHEDGANSYLTQGGEDAVRAGFGGKGNPRGASASKKKKPASEKTE